MIGIFWLILAADGIELLDHAIPLDAGEDYGDCITDPLGHYDAWEAMRREQHVLASRPTRPPFAQP